MRFAESGYYLEAYVKCANCGVLIVTRGPGARRSAPPPAYCSAWCEDWHRKRKAELAAARPAPRRS
jgi:5-oxoprolinase (ATP-hydrolysing)/N-methylhydantoinase B